MKLFSRAIAAAVMLTASLNANISPATEQGEVFTRDVPYEININIGDIDGDGNEDIASLYGSNVSIVKMGDDGLPLGEATTFAIGAGGVPSYHDQAFIDYMGGDVFWHTDYGEDTQHRYRINNVAIIDMAYLGNMLNGKTIVLRIRRRDGHNYKSDALVTVSLDERGVVTKHYVVPDDLVDLVGEDISQLCRGMGSVGDLNGDGINELLVVREAPITIHPDNGDFEGSQFSTKNRATIYTFNTEGIVVDTTQFDAGKGHITEIEGYTDSDTPFYMSGGISNVGDLNGDGFSDIMMNGVVFCMNGEGNFLDETYNLQQDLLQVFPDNLFGYRTYHDLASGYKDVIAYMNNIHFLGDIDGDGYQEVSFRSTDEINEHYRVIYSITPGLTKPALLELSRFTIEKGTFPEAILIKPEISNFLTKRAYEHRIIKSTSYKNSAGDVLVAADQFIIADPDFTTPSSLTDEEKMLAFMEADLWSITDNNAVISSVEGSDPGDKDLKIEANNWGPIKLEATTAITQYDNGSGEKIPFTETNIERVKVQLKVAFEGYKSQISGDYIGNVQLYFDNAWTAQFELNTAVAHDIATGETSWLINEPIAGGTDGRQKYLFHALYEVVLPLYVVEQLNNGDNPKFELRLSTTAGKKVTLKQLTFIDADSDNGRDIYDYLKNTHKIITNDKDYVFGLSVSWDEYYLRRFDNSKVGLLYVESTRIDKWGDEVETYKYYELKQDVDYPLYLAHLWSGQLAYRPETPYKEYQELWRQCWNYVGQTDK